MNAYKNNISDILVFQPEVYEDNRGAFAEIYNLQEFENKGVIDRFVQDNYSFSYKNVLRGLHYQIKHAQGKLIRVISGEVFDVAVDLRRNSSTFGEWVGTYLSSKEMRLLWIPIGFAHGYYTLSDYAEIMYKVTDYYSPEFERTLIWNDSDININWPLSLSQPPLLSAKDSLARSFREIEVFD